MIDSKIAHYKQNLDKTFQIYIYIIIMASKKRLKLF